MPVLILEVGVMKSEILLDDTFKYDDVDIMITDFFKHSALKFNKDKTRHNNLTYIYNGKAVCSINGEPNGVEQGNIVYTSKTDVFELQAHSGTIIKLYSIDFQYSYLNREYKKLPFSNIMDVKIDIPLVNLFEELNEVWTKKRKGYKFKARAIGLQIIYEILFNAYVDEDTIQPSNRINIIKRYIAAHYHEDIRVAALAHLLNLNPVYFGAYFKKKTGYTVNQYINNVRVNIAKKILLSGEYTVGEVANRCGFQDMFYFSKVFKQIEGVPPSHFVK